MGGKEDRYRASQGELKWMGVQREKGTNFGVILLETHAKPGTSTNIFTPRASVAFGPLSFYHIIRVPLTIIFIHSRYQKYSDYSKGFVIRVESKE